MMTTNCMTGLQPLKTPIAKPRINEMILRVAQILEAQLGSTYKARLILKEVQMYFLKTCAMTWPCNQFS